MTDPLAAERYRAATFSAAIFLGAVFYLAYVEERFGVLVTLDGMMFLLVGVLTAAGGIGLLFFRVRVWLAGILARRCQEPPTDADIRLLKLSGTALLTGQVVATWLLGEYLYRWFTG